MTGLQEQKQQLHRVPGAIRPDTDREEQMPLDTNF